MCVFMVWLEYLFLGVFINVCKSDDCFNSFYWELFKVLIVILGWFCVCKFVSYFWCCLLIWVLFFCKLVFCILVVIILWFKFFNKCDLFCIDLFCLVFVVCIVFIILLRDFFSLVVWFCRFCLVKVKLLYFFFIYWICIVCM